MTKNPKIDMLKMGKKFKIQATFRRIGMWI